MWGWGEKTYYSTTSEKDLKTRYNMILQVQHDAKFQMALMHDPKVLTTYYTESTNGVIEKSTVGKLFNGRFFCLSLVFREGHSTSFLKCGLCFCPVHKDRI